MYLPGDMYNKTSIIVHMPFDVFSPPDYQLCVWQVKNKYVISWNWDYK